MGNRLACKPGAKTGQAQRAPLDRPSTSMGALTADEVILTIRPNLRSIMPSTVTFIMNMALNLLASMARSSRPGPSHENRQAVDRLRY